MIIKLTEQEKKIIKRLKNIAKVWPDTLWLFSGSGTLCVMRKKDEKVVMDGFSVDYRYIVDYIDIENDGGDW